MWEEEHPEGQRLEVAGQLGKAGGGGEGGDTASRSGDDTAGRLHG